MSPYYAPAPKEPPQCVWPRQYSVLTLPLSRRHAAEISLPDSMTELEWGRMMSVLDACKAGVVVQKKAPPAQGDKSLGGGEDYALDPSSLHASPDERDGLGVSAVHDEDSTPVPVEPIGAAGGEEA